MCNNIIWASREEQVEKPLEEELEEPLEEELEEQYGIILLL